MNKKVLIIVISIWFLLGLTLTFFSYYQEENIYNNESMKDSARINSELADANRRKSYDLENYGIYSRQEINDRDYVLVYRKKDPADYKQFLYELNDGELRDLYGNLSKVEKFITNDVNDFWIDFEEEKIYLIRYLGKELDFKEELVSINYTELVPSAEQLYTMENELYENSDFLGYNRNANTFILETAGGDSCGGWGDIWTLNLNTMEETVITDIASGCSLDAPRLVRYTDRGIIMAETVECTNVQWLELRGCTSSLYLLNPLNPTDKEVIYEFNEPYKYDVGYREFYIENPHLDFNNKVVIYEQRSPVNNDAKLLNIETGEITPVEETE